MAPRIEIATHHNDFGSIVGDNLNAQLLAEDESGAQLYHEACVYHAPSKSIFVTSNQIKSKRKTNSDNGKEVKLFRIIDTGRHTSSPAKPKIIDVTPPQLINSMLNGGVNYGKDALLMCAQGSMHSEDNEGLVVLPLDTSASEDSKDAFTAVDPLVTNFHGKSFNSVNDVIVDPVDGAIWFTDPCYGHHQGCRSAPVLPNQVYRYDKDLKTVRAVADGFMRPNGLCLSPDNQIMYITDTGAIHGSKAVPFDHSGPSHIFAFDVHRSKAQGTCLTNRRLFAYAPGMVPDGIKCDTAGNVYSGCGDGVEVWNPAGELIGTIKVPGGVANFCFGEKGDMYICNETRFWRVTLEKVRGALLGI